MVSAVEELDAVRAILDEAVERVRARGLAVTRPLPLGAMIEVPASALVADALASRADFLSIGTNDLVQYALAVDRGNRALAHLATPLHPAILRLIANVVEAAARYDCPLSVCGEMASDPLGAFVLTGLGVRALSMEPAAIPRIKAALSMVSTKDLRDIASRALSLTRAADVEALVRGAFDERLRHVLGAEGPLLS
jgi:phosphotransferase system enzyme I (PtsI)